MVIENDTPYDDRRAANLRLRVETGPVFLSNIYNISVLVSDEYNNIYNRDEDIWIVCVRFLFRVLNIRLQNNKT